MFSNLPPLADDPILNTALKFQADERTHKMDLSVGVYRNAQGVTPVMQAIREAQKTHIANETTKVYQGMAGNLEFCALVNDLVMGPMHNERVKSVQSVGGTGALRILSDLIKVGKPNCTVWVPNPTWANHGAIIQAAGLAQKTYRYFDADTMQVNVPAMLEDLATAGPNDAVILHGCCHNPTGAELSPQDWDKIAALAEKNGFLPFVDLAYMGFAEGLEADVYGVRKIAAHVPRMLVSASCSKNFGIYRERTGCAIIMGENAGEADFSKKTLMQRVRENYSMPPSHGASLVIEILRDAALRRVWEEELDSIRNRINGLRRDLAAALRQRTNSDRFDFIERQRGMFSLLGTNVDDVAYLQDIHAIYAVGAGRINIAGLSEELIPPFADALVDTISANVGGNSE
ncbi:MAG: amino acid aminotransferase [Pseudomonadota bacterium]